MNFSFNDLTFFHTTTVGTASNPITLNPLDYPNMLRWYKADSFNVPDGTGVGVSGNPWIDNSPNADHAWCSSNTNFPIISNNRYNNLPSVNFRNSTGAFLSGSGIIFTGNWTIFTVFYSDLTGKQTIYGDSVGGSSRTTISLLDDSLPGTIQFGMDLSAFSLQNEDVFSRLKFAALSVTGTSNQFYDRRTSLYPALSTNLNSNNTAPTGKYLRIGYRNQAAGFSAISGDICEILLYQTGMSSGLMDSFLNNYFRPKWGF